jgi:hypothetical protein
MRKTPSTRLVLALLLGISMTAWTGSSAAFSQKPARQSGVAPLQAIFRTDDSP